MAEWLIESLTAKVRADADFAAWAGTDTLGDTRFYFGQAPPDEILFADPAGTGTTANPLRYVVWRIEAADAPTILWDGREIHRWHVRLQFVDKSDGTGRPCAEGFELFRAIFVPYAQGVLDGLEYCESPSPTPEPVYTDSSFTPETDFQGPAPDESSEAWVGYAQYIAEAQRAPA